MTDLEKAFPSLTSLHVGQVSRITLAPVPTIKEWVRRGQISRPPLQGKCFAFATENVMEVLLMRMLCHDIGMQAKVAAQAIALGGAKSALREFSKDNVYPHLYIEFDGLSIIKLHCGGDLVFKNDKGTFMGYVCIPIGAEFAKVLERAAKPEPERKSKVWVSPEPAGLRYD